MYYLWYTTALSAAVMKEYHSGAYNRYSLMPAGFTADRLQSIKTYYANAVQSPHPHKSYHAASKQHGNMASTLL